MREANRPSADQTAAQDIVDVLAAERSAREAVADCARQADVVVNQALEQAKRIAARGEARINRLREACARRVAEQRAAHEALTQALAAEATAPGADERLRAAIRSLAAELTGGVDGRRPGA